MNKLQKFSFTLLVALFSAASSFSQTLAWENELGNNEIEYCNSSAKVSSTRYVFGGYVNRNVQVGDLAVIMITDVNGNIIQRKTYPSFFSGRIYALTSDDNNAFIALGQTFDTLNQQLNILLFKADSSGNVIWQKQYPVPGTGNTMKIMPVPGGYLFFASGLGHLFRTDRQGNLIWQKPAGNVNDIALMQDGSYLASGFTMDKGAPTSLSTFYRTSPYLVQLRPNGDTIRTKVFGSVYDHDLLNSVRETADGGVILVGRYVQNMNPTRQQGMIIKLDSLWNQEWWLTFYPNWGAYDYGCELYDVQETIDSSFIASGYFSDLTGADGFVVKVNSSGTEVWRRQFTVNTKKEEFYNMIYETDGSAVFSGVRNNGNQSGANYDFYIAKVQNLGLPYVPDYCQSLPAADFTATLLPGDTIAFTDLSSAGTRYGSISTWSWRLGDGTTSTDSLPKHKYSQPLSQLYNTPVTLIVTSNSGCTDSITLYPFRHLSTSSTLPHVQVQLYPNPVQQQANIRIMGYSQELQLELQDVLGRKVDLPVQQLQQGETQQLQLNTAALPAGLYIYRLLSEGEIVATGRLIKNE